MKTPHPCNRLRLLAAAALGIVAAPMARVAAFEVQPLTAELARQYDLDTSFYQRATMVQGILIATSARVPDRVHLEAAYQFDSIMRQLREPIARRIRDSKVLCLLVGVNELTSELPQFATDKTGEELDFYNWRQRGFLTRHAGRPTVLFAEEDVLEYKGAMQKESILIHEFGHVIHGTGFDDALKQSLTATYEAAVKNGLWNDGRAAQRFRRVRGAQPVLLLDALAKAFPAQPTWLLERCLDHGDILVNDRPTNSKVRVTGRDEVLIVFGGGKRCYAGKNRAEYWAEGVQSWFDTNRTMDHDHNHIHTREQLKDYDPGLANLCEQVLGDSAWRFVSPRKRAGKDHLGDYDPSKAPDAEDPEHLKKAANDYYDEYWSSYWQRLHDRHSASGPATDLDGAVGNIIKVAPAEQSFVLLKETEYDPKTDLGRSRFTVHWTDETTVTMVAEKQNHHQPLRPADLATGLWKTTIHGSEAGGRFVVGNMEVLPLPDPRDSDDPKLPRVLVIGDSISMNYHEAAKAALDGRANYHRNEGNSFSTAHGVRNANLWLGDHEEKGLRWDVIQFNHGLHDLKQVYDKANDSFGAYAVPLDDYKANLEKEIAILRKTGAKLIWCSTTPVPNHNKGKYARRKGAAREFNEAALEVMRRHPDILVNDIYQIIGDSPVFDDWRKGTDVHFYREEEQKLLGRAAAAAVQAALPRPAKSLPLPGEVFTVARHTAFLILPQKPPPGKPIPWVWYAPTLPNLPGKHEQWMFERFLADGVAIAGVDVGESMGNPAGRAIYSALYEELVGQRGMAPRPCLLARSRGGLMLYNWATEHPRSVAGIAGIYPVGNLASWPGLARACPAYGISAEDLAAQAGNHNPVDRLAPLAEARVPIMHIHGDRDGTVPLEQNSGLIRQRYSDLGGRMTLEVITGGGHDLRPHWFNSQSLVEFVTRHAKGDS